MENRHCTLNANIFWALRRGVKQAGEMPDIFGMKAGDMLMVLGDEVPGLRGLALVGAEELIRAAKKL